MELSQKQMTFSQFFAAFFKSKLNFEYFDKKYDPHSFCISEITDCENVVREMSKKSRFRGCFDKQYGKRAHAMLKSESQYLYHIHFSLARKLFSKKSLLLTCQILGLCANTLATDKRYPVLNRESLTIRIQMQLSPRKNFFFLFYAPFLKSILNFKLFESEDDLHRFCIFEVTDSENVVREMSKKCRFRGWFEKQYGKHA